MSKKLTIEEFQEDIIGLIQKHYPSALRGDIGQSQECASALGMTMGGLLAQSYRLNGEVIGRTTLHTMVTRIVDSASRIDEAAGAAIRAHVPKLQ